MKAAGGAAVAAVAVLCAAALVSASAGDAIKHTNHTTHDVTVGIEEARTIHEVGVFITKNESLTKSEASLSGAPSHLLHDRRHHRRRRRNHYPITSCFNGGICVLQQRCICPQGFSGLRCQWGESRVSGWGWG